MDIFDIPITTITEQYLAYLEMMKALNISVAGDFLVMASTLVHIKSKMLLPTRDEDGEEEDPRTEITRPLLEYMRIKDVAEELSRRELLGRDVFSRQDGSWYEAEPEDQGPSLDISLFQLIDAFRRIVERNEPRAMMMTFRHERWSIKEKARLILSCLKDRQEMMFEEIFSEDRKAPEFIVTFLALLELVHIGLVKVFQTSFDTNEIRIMANLKTGGTEDLVEKMTF